MIFDNFPGRTRPCAPIPAKLRLILKSAGKWGRGRTKRSIVRVKIIFKEMHARNQNFRTLFEDQKLKIEIQNPNLNQIEYLSVEFATSVIEALALMIGASRTYPGRQN